MRAAIWRPDRDDADRWERLCVEWCDRHGAEIVAVVQAVGDGARQWRDVVQAIFDGQVDLVVAGRDDHLPPDRAPRVVIIIADPGPDHPQRRRPRRLR